jgi:ribosomal-protein-alanine N-acetyltransferase
MTIDALFVRMPRIETPHLILRAIEPSDAEAIFATFADEVAMEFYGELPHRSVDETRALMRRQGEWYAQRAGVRWGIARKGDDTVIGSCGFHNFDEGFRRAELGYELRRTHWRQGIMTEALGALLTFGFGSLGMHRIEAIVNGENERSMGLLRKLGFTYEGTLRRRFYFRDQFWDEHYFGLLAAEWRQS